MNDIPQSTKQKINDFYKLLDDIKDKIETQSPSSVVKYVIEKTELEKLLKSDDDYEEDRLGNVKELVNLATKYDSMSTPEGIEKFIEESILASDQDSLNDAKDGVKLMTVHASKGLEFDHVFISGLEQDLFPSSRRDEGEDQEEERRLFYVALTRARKNVYLSYSNMRTVYGSKQINTPSEFIYDISDEFIKQHNQEEIGGIKSIFIDF